MAKRNKDESNVAVAKFNSALQAAILKPRTSIRAVHPSGLAMTVQLASFVPGGSREDYVAAIRQASAGTVAISGDKSMTDDKPIGKSGGTIDLASKAGQALLPLLCNAVIR